MAPTFEDIYRKLASTRDTAPWRTARGLARALSQDVPFRNTRITPDSVTETLMEFCPEKVRYSSAPSANSLEVLWGAVCKVGTRRLRDLRKDNVEDRLSEGFHEFKQGDVFFSHSHRDWHDVWPIATQLAGAHIRTWLAETDVRQHQHINGEILEAIGENNFVLVYLTENSLKSTWVAKEISQGVRQNKPISIIADLRSQTIQQVLKFEGNALPDEIESSHVWRELLDQDLLRDEFVRVFGYPVESNIAALSGLVVHSFNTLPQYLTVDRRD